MRNRGRFGYSLLPPVGQPPLQHISPFSPLARLFSHVDDPFLDDPLPREYVLYLRPSGPLRHQLSHFWEQSRVTCAKNKAHNIFPHITRGHVCMVSVCVCVSLYISYGCLPGPVFVFSSNCLLVSERVSGPQRASSNIVVRVTRPRLCASVLMGRWRLCARPSRPP